ncbi:hypothetical protein [Roseiarcus sp.]|uniref:hypothetical protein n=1 Tax=Roseiarcus sp. TaxID=1969460 RepID=UPI003F96A387
MPTRQLFIARNWFGWPFGMALDSLLMAIGMAKRAFWFSPKQLINEPGIELIA